MHTLQEIEAAIDELPRNEAYELCAKLEKKLSDNWDRQIESDVRAGRLDNIAREALAEYHAGFATNFPPDEK